MTNLTIIVAMDENQGIGLGNSLPWEKIPEDFAHFKRHTTGKPIIMGRKTYDSIGRPLPNRRNIVITRNTDWKVEGVNVVHSFEDALQLVGDDAAFIIGGAEIYEEALKVADHMLITLIHGQFKSDTYFPKIDEKEWKMMAEEKRVSEPSGIPFSFITAERVHHDSAEVKTMGEREIMLHHAEPNKPETDIRVFAIGHPDEAGDFHRYRITGFATNNHPDEYKGSGHYLADLFFQRGDPSRGWNGLTLESLLAVAADRLDHIQQGPYACPENEAALTNVHRAIRFLHSRHNRLLNEAAELAESRAKEDGPAAQAKAVELMEKGLDTSMRTYEEPKPYEELVKERTEATVVAVDKLVEESAANAAAPTINGEPINTTLSEEELRSVEVIKKNAVAAAVDQLMVEGKDVTVTDPDTGWVSKLPEHLVDPEAVANATLAEDNQVVMGALAEAPAGVDQRPIGEIVTMSMHNVDASAQAGVDVHAHEAAAEQATMDTLQETTGQGDTGERRRLVPALRDDTEGHFLMNRDVRPLEWEMGQNIKVESLPLKLNMAHDLIALANHPQLLAAGLASETDTIDPEGLALEGFFVEFETHRNGASSKEILAFGVHDDNASGDARQIVPGGNAAGMMMTFLSDPMTLNEDTVDGNDSAPGALNFLVISGLEVQFNVSIAGSVNVETGSCIFSASPLELVRVVDYGSKAEVEVAEEMQRDISNLLNAARVVGVDLIAYRKSHGESAA